MRPQLGNRATDTRQNRHEAKRPSVIRLLYLQDLHVVGYTEIGLSRLYLASYNKARGHDETPEATEPQA